MIDTYINWSGGKDAAFALWKIRREARYNARCLFTTFSEAHRRVSMHGVREELMDLQADRIGLPFRKAWLPENASMPDYNRIMGGHAADFKAEGIRTAVFGDIFLEDLRRYREEQLAGAGMDAVFPLWKTDSAKLVQDFIAAGFRAVIVCVNARYLPATFAGREIDRDFLADLPAGVDPCGENGEFHSFVFDGPLFSAPVPYSLGDTVERTYTPVSSRDSDNCYKKDDDCFAAQPAAWDTRFYFRELLPA
ncbi:Dph6-related ATP pyrophosphatase [Chitinophaga lutea]